jgi:hypothetical protein
MKEIDLLKWKVEDEGIDYAVFAYSSWDKIKDDKFHELRQKFLEARFALINYIDEL